MGHIALSSLLFLCFPFRNPLGYVISRSLISYVDCSDYFAPLERHGKARQLEERAVFRVGDTVELKKRRGVACWTEIGIGKWTLLRTGDDMWYGRRLFETYGWGIPKFNCSGYPTVNEKHGRYIRPSSGSETNDSSETLILIDVPLESVWRDEACTTSCQRCSSEKVDGELRGTRWTDALSGSDVRRLFNSGSDWQRRMAAFRASQYILVCSASATAEWTVNDICTM